MRTRLDEIVEEEGYVGRSTFWPGDELKRRQFYDDALRKVAERAFRHGVERATDGMRTACNLKLFGIEFDTKNVQPAPAGEKFCCWRHSTHGGPHICECGDRRNGERRKEQWMQQLNTSKGFKMKPWPAFDRRSGKERRKP